MKALTLRHPWSFAIAHLGKRIENRDWDARTADLMGLPQLVGETIAIHGGTAPQRPKRAGHWSQLAETNLWRQHCEDLQGVHRILGGKLPDSAAQYLARRGVTALTPEAFILPGVVAVATISGTTHSSTDPWAARGALHIHLTNVITLPEPVQCSGKQGFWDLGDDLTAIVQARLTPPAPQQWGHLTAQDWLA
ncbi:hypothetical protein [Deinococcus kurensis]|uniref:hypothetical protein n=1 Tax=Deinococcus kurensis TaxID=2662757 RepID=UPI0012D331F3|nr:hypothetical protein [Deinococcus kurensis]